MKERLNRADFAKRQVDWVFMEIRDIDSQTEQIVSTTAQIADKFGADYRMFGSLVLMTLGTTVCESPWEGKPQELIRELSRAFGSTAKILYGSLAAPCGFLSGAGFSHYALLPPYLSEARHHVGSLDWGEVVEFQPKNYV